MKNAKSKTRKLIGLLLFLLAGLSAMAQNCGYWYHMASSACANYMDHYDMYEAYPSENNFNRMNNSYKLMEMMERAYNDCMEEN